ncbi:19.5g6 protein [Bracoviriform inaniti]|uniref:19.5g6 protein n=1 Tax=Bracoviriform inaniti TaxID=36344 RepID=A8E102_9VIRU|nr:19.5g6 protein [Bracoviriform inaniti]CAO98972.1 19.5g6 protein [Bracoviriform inaniti]
MRNNKRLFVRLPSGKSLYLIYAFTSKKHEAI